MDTADISKYLHEEGSKKGFNAAQISKTLKMLKKGKLDLSAIAPQLAGSVTEKLKSSNPSKEELRRRLNKKISAAQDLRAGKQAKKPETIS